MCWTVNNTWVNICSLPLKWCASVMTTGRDIIMCTGQQPEYSVVIRLEVEIRISYILGECETWLTGTGGIGGFCGLHKVFMKCHCVEKTAKQHK